MKSEYKIQDGLTDWGVYTLLFFLILAPFYEIGLLKLLSIATILGFFAGFINRFLREYYFYLENHNNEERYDTDYKSTVINRSLPDIEFKVKGERAPNND